MNEIGVMKYLLDETEKEYNEIKEKIKKGETGYWSSYGKRASIRRNLTKIRQLALKISKELDD